MKSKKEKASGRHAIVSILPKNESMITASKLSAAQKELADRIESALGAQWVNDAGNWTNRIKAEPKKSERVIAEIESALKESRKNETPAQYAEQIWKEFAR